MEACAASVTIRNAGEFNGFLRPKVRLFAEPLRFIAGELLIPPGFQPTIDAECPRGPRDRMRALCTGEGRLDGTWKLA